MGADDMLSWLRETITRDLEKARAAGGEEWTLGKDGQELYLAPANAEPEPWNAERITQWTFVVDHCCHPEQWDECDITKQEHIALHDPRDTIARCEAELRILDEMIPIIEELDYIAMGEGLGSVPFGEPVARLLRLVASGYRHRPGFNPDWVS